jgi:hypothetical protein
MKNSFSPADNPVLVSIAFDAVGTRPEGLFSGRDPEWFA